MRKDRFWQALATLLVAVALIVVQRYSKPGGTGPSPAPTGEVRTEPRGPVVREPGPAAPSGGGRTGIGFRSRAALEEHHRKHGPEFGGRISVDEYLRKAQALRDAPAGGSVLEFKRDDGVITRFDRKGGEFLAFNRDLTIRTFFRPNDGEAYFRRQRERDEP